MPPPPAAASTVVREIFYDSDSGAPSAGRFLEERVALARESGNEIRYTYNRNGSVVREDATVGASTLITLREYNLRQEVIAITYPDGHRIEYVLDGSGAVQRITVLSARRLIPRRGDRKLYVRQWGSIYIRARSYIQPDIERKAGSCVKHEVTKEAVGILVLLTRSIFACDILRKLLPSVSLAKLTSAPMRF
jgi:YD repeat-containing protein